MKNSKEKLVLTISLLLCILPGFAYAEVDTAQQTSDKSALVSDRPGFADDYAGWASDGSSATILGTYNIQLGLHSYYAIFSHWPASWAEVEAEGLVQTTLPGYHNEAINPDDLSLDFYGDLTYDPTLQPDGSVKVVELAYIQGPKSRIIKLMPGTTFRERFESMYESWGDQRFIDYLADVDRLKLYQAVGSLRRAAYTYADLHGTYPCELSDLLDSGVAVFDRDSINPLTGQPFRGDGSANDIYYEWVSDEEVIIEPVQADGTLWEFRMTL